MSNETIRPLSEEQLRLVSGGAEGPGACCRGSGSAISQNGTVKTNPSDDEDPDAPGSVC